MRHVNQNKRQFIAGAICPSCNKEDSIVQIIIGEHEHIECIACDHREGRPTPDMLATAHAVATPVDDSVSIVSFKP